MYGQQAFPALERARFAVANYMVVTYNRGHLHSNLRD